MPVLDTLDALDFLDDLDFLNATGAEVAEVRQRYDLLVETAALIDWPPLYMAAMGSRTP